MSVLHLLYSVTTLLIALLDVLTASHPHYVTRAHRREHITRGSKASILRRLAGKILKSHYTLLTLYGLYTRKLTFENMSHRKPLQPLDLVHQPLHLLRILIYINSITILILRNRKPL
jgi:hypothetical protein